MVLNCLQITLTVVILIFISVRDNLKQIKSNSTRQKNRLKSIENRTSDHFARVCSHFPALSDEEVPTNGIALPSSYPHISSNSPQFLRLCGHELDLRVGHGHDLLQLVRNAVVLHHHYSIQYAHTRGIAQMEKIAKLQSKASKKRAADIANYTKNWRKIQNLLQMIGEENGTAQLKGLQELNANDDVKYFSTLADQTGPFVIDQTKQVSWIWRVAMLHSPTNGNDTSVSSREEQWASEGMNISDNLSSF
jgi:hypothetical protein